MDDYNYDIITNQAQNTDNSPTLVSIMCLFILIMHYKVFNLLFLRYRSNKHVSFALGFETSIN